MSQIEKFRYPLLAALAALTVAAFLGLKESQPLGFVSDRPQAATATDETTAGNCGRCKSQNGPVVDCYKPTQRYTCASKASACASICQ